MTTSKVAQSAASTFAKAVAAPVPSNIKPPAPVTSHGLTVPGVAVLDINAEAAKAAMLAAAMPSHQTMSATPNPGIRSIVQLPSSPLPTIQSTLPAMKDGNGLVSSAPNPLSTLIPSQRTSAQPSAIAPAIIPGMNATTPNLVGPGTTDGPSQTSGAIPDGSGGGGGGDGGGNPGISPVPYDDGSYDPSNYAPPTGPVSDPDAGGGYYDPQWDNATTAVPATTAVLTTSTGQTTSVSPTATAPQTSTAGTVTPVTFWQKFLSWFGLQKKPVVPTVTAAVHGELGTLQAECGSLVRRARMGDQNAMAILCQIRDNAKLGNPEAMKSQPIIMAYIDAHPPGSDADMHGDMRVTIEHNDMKLTIEHLCCPVLNTAVSLSHGEPLTNPRISQYMSQFGADIQRAMAHGIMHPRAMPLDRVPNHLKSAHAVGRAIGTARRLQAVRLHDSSISALDPNIGWEYGEG